MNWHSILHSRLSDLLRGRTSEYLHPFRFPRPSFRLITTAPRLIRRLNLFNLISLLARIVKCNAPLPQGIAAAAAGTPSWRLGYVLNGLSHDLESGLSLAQAMRRNPGVFPPLYADLVEAGERTGTLDQTLDRIMASIVERRVIRRDLRSLMFYVAIVLSLFTLFSWFLYVKVVPVFLEINHEMGAPTHFRPYVISRAIVNHAELLLTSSGVVALAIFAGLIGTRFFALFRRLRPLRRIGGFIALRLPLVKRLVRNSNMANATQMLAQLTEAGYPLDDALEKVASGNLNPAFNAAFLRMRDAIRQGAPLAKAADAETRLLPKSFPAIAAIADYSGDLPGALGHLAGLYRAQACRQMQMVTPVLLPVMVIALAALAFTTYFAIFALTVSMAEAVMASM